MNATALADTPIYAGQKKFWVLPRCLTSEHPLPWILPATATLVVFGLYPILYAIWLSLHRRHPVTRENQFNPEWNWSRVFADERVWDAIAVTFTYTFVAIVIQLVLGLAIALLLDSDRKGFGLMRALMTLPLVVPPAVTGMMFILMYNNSFGVISRSLHALGLLSPDTPVLATGALALWAIMIADIWQWTPLWC